MPGPLAEIVEGLAVAAGGDRVAHRRAQAQAALMGPSRPDAPHRDSGIEGGDHVQHASFRRDRVRRVQISDLSLAHKGPEVAGRRQVGVQ